MSFRDVDTPTAAAAYVDKLNQKWPVRFEVMDEIVAHLKAQCSGEGTVIELCSGAGMLGHHLLTQLPAISYIGFDQSEPLLAAAEETLAPFSNRATVRQADLNQDEWSDALTRSGTKVHAIVSMQSLHDLGGEAEVSRIYRLAHTLLAPAGLFMNADLIVEPGEELANNPGRLTIERHLALLTEYGYQNPSCTLERGGFGVLAGTAFLR